MSPQLESNLNDKGTRPAVGAAPGTLVLPKDACFPKISVAHYDNKLCEYRSLESVDEIEQYRTSRSKLWIDVCGLGDEKILNDISKQFGIHPLALEDIVHVPQRPKVQDYGPHRLFFLRMLTIDPDNSIRIEQLSLVVGTNYLITFQERPGDVLEPIRRRLTAAGRSPLRTKSSDFLAYAIIDAIVDAYRPVIESIGDQIEDLEEEVFSGSGKGMMQRLTELRSTLLSLRRSITPLREAINQTIRDDSIEFDEAVYPFLQDVYDHCLNAVDMVETYRELAAGLINSHLSVVSNRMNEIMKVLTVMSTIFIPLTFLSGLYGMNFAWMPERDWKWSYPILLGLMALISGSLLLYFKRRGWFDDS